MGLNITVVSFMNTLYWGLIACRETVPGLWDLAGFIPDALAELLEGADHPEPHAADGDLAADRIPVAEAGLLIDGQVDTRETAATIIDLAEDGRGVAQVDGKVVFEVS